MDKNQHRRRKKRNTEYEQKFIFPISFEEAMKRMGEDKREDTTPIKKASPSKKSGEQSSPET